MPDFEDLERDRKTAKAGGHVAIVCNGCERGCMFCEGGLFGCQVCGGLEGAMPTECPGRQMTTDESDRVYAGNLDFVDGRWQHAISRATPVYFHPLVVNDEQLPSELAGNIRAAFVGTSDEEGD